MAGSNVTFVMKDPTGAMHYEVIDACRESIDRPHDFKFCPNKDQSDSFTCGGGSLVSPFSIKNNCKTPYCTKVVTDWSSFGDEQDLTTLAFVSIAKENFDPIVDPDLVDLADTKKE